MLEIELQLRQEIAILRQQLINKDNCIIELCKMVENLLSDSEEPEEI
jgi:hypothetical protein